MHTANPITGARNEIFGEVVAGMGEALVGNSPGRALSFSAAAPANGAAANVTLLSLPSKRLGMFSPRGLSNLIARSDSNGEDLEAFAGAGESALLQTPRPNKKCGIPEEAVEAAVFMVEWSTPTASDRNSIPKATYSNPPTCWICSLRILCIRGGLNA